MEEGKIDFAQKFLRTELTETDKKITVAKEQRIRWHARSGPESRRIITMSPFLAEERSDEDSDTILCRLP